MIVVDASALLAVLFDESDAEQCSRTLEASTDTRISAGTLVEALIVSTRRNRADDMDLLMDALVPTIEPVSQADARRVVDAYKRWGKGIHPAGLNFGDCFAYALAKQLDCPLLFVGRDFARTDVRSALA